jgi:toxin ParE1/3/4
VTIKWSKTARSDRYELLEYLASVNPSAALGADDRVDLAIEILASYPYAGRPGRVTGTRELVIGGTRYIAAYRVDGETAVILRLFDAAQQWPDSI